MLRQPRAGGRFVRGLRGRLAANERDGLLRAVRHARDPRSHAQPAAPPLSVWPARIAGTGKTLPVPAALSLPPLSPATLASTPLPTTKLPSSKPPPAKSASATPAPARNARLPYLPGLDGLRALAVIAVVLYHAGIDFMPAGFLGVEIFFVVSGYLITSLLLAERSARGSVSLKHFWARRARRLLPALFLLVAAVLTYFTIFLPDEVASIRGDALASVGYIANWAFIVQDTSYFEQVGRPSPLLHLWSLAIEEQFYLLWPLIFIGLTWLGGRRLLLPAIVLGAIASTWLMAALYQPFGDVSRIYYGTDTRSAGLLIGAALAVVWGAGALPSPRAGVAAWLWRASGLGSALRWSLDVAGLAALGGLVYIVVTWSEFQQSLYQGGFALVSVLTVVVIAATVAPGGLLGRALGVAPLRWIGLRSYAIYLWHWPIFVITRPDLDVSMGDTELLLFRLALTLLLAELSYRLVETPVRRGALGRIWSRLRDQERPRLRRELQRGALVFPALGGAIALAFVVAAAQPAAPPSFIPTERVSTIAPAAASAPLRTQAAPLDDSTLTDGAHAVLQRIPPAPGALTTSPASSTIERLGAASVSTIAPPTGVPAASAPPTGSPATTLASPPPPPGSISARFGVGLGIAAPDPGADQQDAESSQLRTAAVDLDAPSPNGPDPALRLDGEEEVGRILASTPVLRPPPPPPPPPFTAVGDSVMLGAAPQLQATFGAIGTDAEVSRHVDPAIALLRGYNDAGLLADTIILHLGNNGPLYPEQFQAIMELLHDRTVFFVNVRVPRQWQDWNNGILRDGVAQYSNAILIDWYAASDDSPEIFWDDGYHLRPDGAQRYTDLIAAAVLG